MTLERKFYIGIAISSILILVAAFVIPGTPGDPKLLPWKFEKGSPDSLTIFGVALGHSNTNQAEAIFEEEAKPTLFMSKDKTFAMEFFFESVHLVGLKSKIIVTVQATQEQLEDMYQRGLRISGTTSGRKITLTPEDEAVARTFPITSLTYIPAATIEASTFEKRFGKPSEIIKEQQSDVSHWLYKDVALDIAFEPGERPILQYTLPANYEQLVKPLLAQDQSTEKKNQD